MKSMLCITIAKLWIIDARKDMLSLLLQMWITSLTFEVGSNKKLCGDRNSLAFAKMIANQLEKYISSVVLPRLLAVRPERPRRGVTVRRADVESNGGF